MDKVIKNFVEKDGNKITIVRSDNGRYFNEYTAHGAGAGPFKTLKDAEKMLHKHRPTAKLQRNIKDLVTKNVDRLRLGDTTCVIRDKITGKERLAEGSVVRVPYKPTATAKDKKKYGKNMVYVIYRDNEEIVSYRQKASQVSNIRNVKIKTKIK